MRPCIVTVTPTYIQAPDLIELTARVPAEYASEADVGGCLYAFEVGEMLKIGFTTKPMQRLSSWRTVYEGVGISLGSAILTVPHLGAKRHETKLLSIFSERSPPCGNREIFRASIRDFIEELANLPVVMTTPEEGAALRVRRKAENQASFQRMMAALFNELDGAPSQSFAESEAKLRAGLIAMLDVVPSLWRILLREDFAGVGLHPGPDKADEIARECQRLASDNPAMGAGEIIAEVLHRHLAIYMDA